MSTSTDRNSKSRKPRNLHQHRLIQKATITILNLTSQILTTTAMINTQRGDLFNNFEYWILKRNFPILRGNTKICLGNETFPVNFIKIYPSWGRSFPPLVVPFPSAKFQKVLSPTRILMKFTGKVSFIIVMILSKFQNNCVTQILVFPLNIGN